MVCYNCLLELQVYNSRPQKRLNQVWRRRRCTLCDINYTTTEVIDYRKSLFVSGSDMHDITPFERDRLMLSLYKSLGHRPAALQDAGNLCATIISKLMPAADKGIISRQYIVKTTLVALQRFDELAAQHYLAFHKE